MKSGYSNYPTTSARRNLVAGTDFRRRASSAARRLLKFRTLRVRRSLADEQAAGTRLRIAPELGFLVVPEGGLSGVDDVVQATQGLIASAPPEKREWAGKQHLRTDNLDMRRIDLDSPWLRFALQRDVLSAVIAYLGVVPLLRYIDVWYSCHSASLGDSQFFHCDWGDLSQVKVYVHASNVGRTSGPLVVVGADKSREIREDLHYNYVTRGWVQDDEMDRHLGKEDVHELTGPSGTVDFVDTSRCFHYGSRVARDAPPRVIAVFQFFTPSAFKVPLDHRAASPFRHLAACDLSRLERLVLGLE
jgi:hypothetical protein